MIPRVIDIGPASVAEPAGDRRATSVDIAGPDESTVPIHQVDALPATKANSAAAAMEPHAVP
jgi:hypothetical protein